MTSPVQMSTIHVPPGLQQLSTMDQLLVEQKVGCFQTYNRYKIKNEQGQNVYYAVEEGDCCARMCRPSMSSINIVDNDEQEVIHLRRHANCSSIACFPCCCGVFEKMEIYSPPDELIGTVEETWSWCNNEFDVKNKHGDIILKIERSANLCTCTCEDIDFKVLTPDKSSEVGKISKKWRGLVRELFTGADHFGISFPPNLDVRIKAILLGACFLIDYMYFENNDSTND